MRSVTVKLASDGYSFSTLIFSAAFSSCFGVISMYTSEVWISRWPSVLAMVSSGTFAAFKLDASDLLPLRDRAMIAAFW